MRSERVVANHIGEPMETPEALADLYLAYIDCLNRQDWENLGRHVDDEVEHNGVALKLSGYREMLVRDYEDIPDLRFHIDLLASAPPMIAARLAFDCSPKGNFLGLKVAERRVRFAENVFYRFQEAKIVAVWSVIDKAAIEAQLG